MKLRNPELKNREKIKITEITCPNCNAQFTRDELGLVMFKACTVFSCPICKKTIAIQPKGKEFEIKVDDD